MSINMHQQKKKGGDHQTRRVAVLQRPRDFQRRGTVDLDSRIIMEGFGRGFGVECLNVDVALEGQVELRVVVGGLRERVASPGLPSAAPLVDQNLEDSNLFNHDVKVVEAVGEEVDAFRVQEAFARIPVSD